MSIKVLIAFSQLLIIAFALSTPAKLSSIRLSKQAGTQLGKNAPYFENVNHVDKVAAGSKGLMKLLTKGSTKPKAKIDNVAAAKFVDVAIDFSSGLPTVSLTLDDQPISFVLDTNTPYAVIPSIEISPKNGYDLSLARDGRELRGFYEDKIYPLFFSDYSKTTTIQGSMRNGELRYSAYKDTIDASQLVFLYVGTLWLDLRRVPALLGLAPPGQLLRQNLPDGWLNAYVEQFSWAVMSLGFSLVRDGTMDGISRYAHGSKLRRGDIDPSRFSQPLVYFPVLDPKDHWEISGGLMIINNQVTQYGVGPVRFKNLDPYILLPNSLVHDIYLKLGGKKERIKHSSNYLWTYPCEADVYIVFLFPGSLVQFLMYSDDFNLGPAALPGYCYGAIRPRAPTATTSTFGLPFFLSFYSVYRYDHSGVAMDIGLSIALPYNATTMG